MTHVTVGARTSDPRALYLQSYLDSLLLAIRNSYLGRQAGRHNFLILLIYKAVLDTFQSLANLVIKLYRDA